MPQKNKVGRPKLAKNKVYSPGISVRLTPIERQTIEKAIAASGLTQTEWVRKSLLYVAGNNKILPS